MTCPSAYEPLSKSEDSSEEEYDVPEFTHRDQSKRFHHTHDRISIPRSVDYREVPELSNLDGLEQFAGIATFLAGFVLADFAGFEFSAWPSTVLSEIYLVLMAFVVGNAVFCSVLSIAVLMACRRALDWDISHATAMRERKKQFRPRHDIDDDCDLSDWLTVAYNLRYTAVLPFPLPSYPRPRTFCSEHFEDIFQQIDEMGCVSPIMIHYLMDGPLKSHGFDLFPFAVLVYLFAVCLSALRSHLAFWLDNHGFQVLDGSDPEPLVHGGLALLSVPGMVIFYFGIPMCFFASGLLKVFR